MAGPVKTDKPQSDACAVPGALTTEDEAALVARLRAGDERSFETLVRTFGGRMFAVARRMMGNDEDASDALQDAFLSAFRGMAKFEGGARLGTWLHRVVINASLMRLRTRRRKHERSIEDLMPRFLEDGHQAEPAVAWCTPVARSEAEQRETRAIVRHAIDELPDLYRTVLILRDIEELDTDETATLLEVTAGVVKTRLHRARIALRSLLDPKLRGGSI